MALDETDLDALVSEAAAILDEAAKAVRIRPPCRLRRARRRATTSPPRWIWPSNVRWSRRWCRSTGIEVHGEEFGGADVDSPLVWVLDPIDGTFNYAAGLPTAAILLALVRDGEPVAGLTWLPFTDQRFTAVVGKPLYANGVAQPPLEPAKLADCVVGTGTFDVGLARTVSRPLSGRDSRAVEPEVLADADARRYRPRPGLHRCRNPRWCNHLRRSSLGSRGRCRAGAGCWRHRHRLGTATTGRSNPSRRWPDFPACTARCSTSCGRPATRTTTDESQRPRGPHHPVPGRRRRPGGQGRKLRKSARRRRSRRTRGRLRPRGRRRADLP